MDFNTNATAMSTPRYQALTGGRFPTKSTTSPLALRPMGNFYFYTDILDDV